MKATIQGKTQRADGTFDSYWGETIPAKIAELPHHKAGLSYTATGYGKRIPTRYMVNFQGRWRRVYCCIFSNAGTLYVGKISDFLTIQDIS